MKEYLKNVNDEKLKTVFEVRNAYDAGKLTMEEARAILKEKVHTLEPYEVALIEQELKEEIELLGKENINKEISEEYITLKNEIELLMEENLNEKKLKKILKEYNDKLSMFYEKMRTLYIQNQIKNISYEEKKKYIDNLYKKEIARNKVRQSYFANYNIKEEDFHWNVSFLDGKQYRGKIDLFVGGSPCQSFSLVGKQRGLQDTRGTLFYEFARLVEEIKPKVFIYENVRAVLGNDGGRT